MKKMTAFFIMHFTSYVSNHIFPRYLTAKSVGYGHLEELSPPKSHLDINKTDWFLYRKVLYSFVHIGTY